MNVLKKLGIGKNNAGGSTSAEWWSALGHAEVINSVNPATEKILAHVSSCSVNDYQKIIADAHHAFLQWRQVPAPKRGEIVRQIAEILRQQKDLLGSLITLEMGKPKQEANGEVQEMIDMADFAVGLSRMLYGKTMHSERPAHRMYEQWLPLGVVGVITAFNFPVAVWAWNTFIAAICGNTVIWRPSAKTSLCAIAVQHICNQVMKKNNLSAIFNLFITNNLELTNTFVADKRVSLISFTGSTKVGIHVAQSVAKRMGRCLLECSGNNAIIVDETADLNLVIPAVLFGATGTAGQRCTSTRRLFIHESIFASVLDKLKAAYSKITIGDPMDPKHLMGPLIDRAAVDSFNEAIDAILQAKGEILYGGKTLHRPGFFVEPTLVKAQNHWDIVQRETFAPILYVIQYRNFLEAIELQNNVCQGLSSALFTNNLKHAELFLSARGSDCGIANVNIGTSGAEIGGAFGGEKCTGGGREAGSDSWKTYMRRQTNTINWSDELPLAQGIEFKLA